MPSDIKPLTITQIYNNGDFHVNIKDRFTWKSIEKDYDFKNTLPSKLDISYIEKLDPLISSLQSQKAIIESTSYPNTQYKISGKDDSKGEITIEATYSYLPMEQKIVSNNIKTCTISQTFKIFKLSDSPNFEFVGEKNVTDISQIPELKELKESEILPSYFNTINDKQEFLKFIDVEKTRGYPLEKIDIKASGNDITGTLRIDVDTSRYNNQNSKTKFYKEFTELNKDTTYKMSFKEPNANEFDKKSLLPSEISEELIYKYFVEYQGFNAKDFIVSTLPNNVTGELSVSLMLNNNFPESALSEGTEFVKQDDGTFIAFKKFNGFKTNEMFNNEYQIIFKDLSKLDINSDKDLIDLMKLTPSYIQSKMNESNGEGITINEKKIKNIKELSKLFIKSYGSKVPQNFDTDDNVKAEMFINNSAGEITLKIIFNELEGYPNSISFVETFSEFSKGNDVPTIDVLSFYDQNLFFAVNQDYKKLKPSQMKYELENNDSTIKKFFSMEPTGDYKTAIDNKKFELYIITDDNNGKLIVTIKFKREDIKNTSSLLEYTIEYDGFDHY